MFYNFGEALLSVSRSDNMTYSSLSNVFTKMPIQNEFPFMFIVNLQKSLGSEIQYFPICIDN